MTLTADEIVERACKEPSLEEALGLAAIFEMERIAPAIRSGGQWETCFRFLFKLVIERWRKTKEGRDAK